MLSIVKSMSLIGLDGYLVSVQVDVNPGIPSFGIVGLPDISIKESKERVQTAIKNSSKPCTCKYKKRRVNVWFPYGCWYFNCN